MHKGKVYLNWTFTWKFN